MGRRLLGPLRKRFRPPRRLRLVREGYWFCTITIGVGIAAINTGNNLLYLVLGMMLAFILASGLLSEMVLRGLQVSRDEPARIVAGQPFLMGIDLGNTKRRLPSFSVEVEDLYEGRPLGKRCYFLKIPAGRTQSASYRHVIERRGRVRMDGLRLSTKFPFGLFRKSRDIDLPGELIVFPAIFDVPLPPVDGTRLAGAGLPARARRGEYFALREYRWGDDPRDVHWRKSAQRRVPLVREHQDESGQRVTLQLDNGLPAGATAEQQAALERAISLCASLATQAVAYGHAVALVTRGEAVPLGAGPMHLGRMLRLLALLEPVAPGTPFAAASAVGATHLLVEPSAGARLTTDPVP